ncbi:hypothetical protein D5F01_LYC24063 [Larimichthys crocea]|uniref:Uncharacterized protein n=1 Tax=Larimichthys crocea TaxID=215358 RepID=A0A6G0HFY3_LARCR|nr:hypothetical protein D5F01_LYC24063 [Larimichthys crocea]
MTTNVHPLYLPPVVCWLNRTWAQGRRVKGDLFKVAAVVSSILVLATVLVHAVRLWNLFTWGLLGALWSLTVCITLIGGCFLTVQSWERSSAHGACRAPGHTSTVSVSQKLAMGGFFLTTYIHTWLYYHVCSSLEVVVSRIECDWFGPIEVMSSSFRGVVQLHFLFLSLSILYFTFALTQGDLTPGNSIWLVGYKVAFLVAAVKSTTTYLSLELSTLFERTRQLQCSALSTTSKGEMFALYREESLTNPNCTEVRCSERGFGRDARMLLNPYEPHNPAPVFWCTFTAFLVLYNTAHLVLTPLEYATPLFFGTPAYVLYWGAVRTTQMMLT